VFQHVAMLLSLMLALSVSHQRVAAVAYFVGVVLFFAVGDPVLVSN
jgi:hypothetical protein